MLIEGKLNITSITLDGHVELDKYRYLYFVIMFTFYILIIFSNSIIVGLISLHKTLHEPMYMFIAALLINSVLFSTNIYPKFLIDFLSEKQIISYQYCLFQGIVYYTLVFSEFLLLSFMSYDRYVAICKPLQYQIIMRKTTVNVFLVTSWIVPACETTVALSLYVNQTPCSFTLKGIFCNNLLYNLLCIKTETLPIYGVVMLVSVGILPLLFILFTYSKIFIITYRSRRDTRTKAARTCLPHLLVLINYSCFVSYDVILVRIGADIPNTARLVMTLQGVVYHPLFNPIIYGLQITEITKHLKKFLCWVKPH